ncbi:MAG: glycosyltransferase family 2 protein [Cyanobacteria bacterium K_DeepCast_35m_m1_288]|nr:glycosyltransferase family 2 protein [Cyanobacteria bacterium K_DeepCast_35m_m1_288]
MRRWLQPLARRQAALRLARSPVSRRRSRADAPVAQAGRTPQRQLLLLLVAYHPSPLEVEQLQACLAELPPAVGYAVVVNDHQPGEPVEQLAAGADLFLTNRDNPGYGRAVNRLVVRLGQLPPYIGVLNTDLSWQPGTFEQLLAWLQQHPQVNLAVPQILDEAGTPQKLCKHHPTVLGLFSRRFLPDWLKPTWLKRYDRWYVMADQNYQEVFEAPYLSGCCMLIRSEAFRRAGGFDERYFLYLEDADLTRSLARDGRCVHLPVAGVVHGWGRGNYRNLGLMAVNLASAWHYFRKWGWALW